MNALLSNGEEKMSCTTRTKLSRPFHRAVNLSANTRSPPHHLCLIWSKVVAQSQHYKRRVRTKPRFLERRRCLEQQGKHRALCGCNSNGWTSIVARKKNVVNLDPISSPYSTYSQRHPWVVTMSFSLRRSDAIGSLFLHFTLVTTWIGISVIIYL